MLAVDILTNYRPGSGDWSWIDVRAMILLNDDKAFYDLAGDISFNGVREPVLLGDDGRVWDGHRRILAAAYLDPLLYVPVKHGNGGVAPTPNAGSTTPPKVQP
jgi:hypothetical protein